MCKPFTKICLLKQCISCYAFTALWTLSILKMYLDLEYRIRSDGAFRAELQRRQQRLEYLERLSAQKPAYIEEYHDALYAYIELCNFNLALLTSYYWPNY